MLANDTPTTFLQLAGRDKLTAKSTAIWTIHPYSTGTVYRPASAGIGSLEATFEGGTVTGRKETASRLEDVPDDLVKAIRDESKAKAGSGHVDSGN